VVKKAGKVQLIRLLLDKIIQREDEKRWRHRGLLGHGRFHDLLSWVAYTMIRDDRSFFATEQIAQFVQGQLSSSEGEREDVVNEMAEEFRTRTWLHAEGAQYHFRHEVFTIVLAAIFVIENLTPSTIQNLSGWNRDASNADTVVACARDLIQPVTVLTMAGCLQTVRRPAGVERLIVDLLRDSDMSTQSIERRSLLDSSEIPPLLGAAIKAASEEPAIARAVISCVVPLVRHSKKALQASMCYLALQKPEFLSSPAAFMQTLNVLSALRELQRENQYHHLPFEDLLKETDALIGNDDRLVSAAGLSRRELANPFTYQAQFDQLKMRLQRDQPDGATHTYIAHAAKYLSDYTSSKARAIRGLQPRPQKKRGGR
jgi:hypothetical protein